MAVGHINVVAPKSEVGIAVIPEADRVGRGYIPFTPQEPLVTRTDKEQMIGIRR